MNPQVPPGHALGLRPGVHAVRIGANAMWFLGGLRAQLFTGPSVPEQLVPLLAALTRGEVQADSPDEWVGKLSACGLLGIVARGAGQRASDVQLFISRLSGTDSRIMQSVLQRRLATDTGVFIDFDVGWRSQLAAAISAARIPVNEGWYGLRETPLRVARLEVELAQHRYELALERYGDCSLHLKLCVATELSAAKSAATGPCSEVQLAVVAHWILVVSAGYLAADSLVEDATAMFAPIDPGAPNVGSSPPASNREADAGKGLRGLLLEMCRFAAGTHTTDKETRRIGPSAGNLGSIHALALIPGPVPGQLDALAYSPAEHTLLQYAVVSRHQVEACHLAFTTDAWLIMVAVMRPLARRYGARASRLAHFDGGAAVALARQVARTFGKTACNQEVRQGAELLAALGLPHREEHYRVVGIASVDNSAHRCGAETPGRRRTQSWRLLARRSNRQFSEQAPSLAELESLEADFERMYGPMNVAPHGIRVVRLRRTDRGRVYSRRILDPGCPREEELENLSIGMLVRQAELQRAAVVYLVGFRGATPRPATARRQGTASELLTTLWLAAATGPLSGTLCGDVDLEAVDIKLGDSFEPLALCLGFGGSWGLPLDVAITDHLPGAMKAIHPT